MELFEDEEEGECIFCNIKYAEYGYWICCDTCDNWVCRKCAKLTIAQFKKLARDKSESETQKQPWGCENCQTVTFT